MSSPHLLSKHPACPHCGNNQAVQLVRAFGRVKDDFFECDRFTWGCGRTFPVPVAAEELEPKRSA